MIKVHSKFKFSMFTHYEDMKGNAKCKNLGGLEQGYGAEWEKNDLTLLRTHHKFLATPLCSDHVLYLGLIHGSVGQPEYVSSGIFAWHAK